MTTLFKTVPTMTRGGGGGGGGRGVQVWVRPAVATVVHLWVTVTFVAVATHSTFACCHDGATQQRKEWGEKGL